MIPMALAGCSQRGEIDPTGGIVAVRSACPVAAIPAQTGDITLFNPAGSTDARAIDVVAEITNLRSTCSEGDQLYTEATFTVNARRSDAGAARQVRSEEHTSELQSLMRSSYAVFRLKKKK